MIAKRCPSAKASMECEVYEEVLPRLCVEALRFHGVVADADNSFRWIFTEDAGGEEYSRYVPQHRTVAANWLGELHVKGMELANDLGLPDRGPAYFLNFMRMGCKQIRACLVNPALTRDDCGVLEGVLTQCNSLDRNWGQIDEWCANLPRTFVHGDLDPSNLRIRKTPGRTSLLPFDWEHAGWGVPAVDLKLPGVDVAAYLSAVKRRMPGLDVEVVIQLHSLGRLFELLLCIYLDGCLGSPWVERQMKHMRLYAAELSVVTQALGLEA